MLRGTLRALAWGWPFLVLFLLFALYLGWERRPAGGAAGFGLSGAIGPDPATQPSANPDATLSPRRFLVGVYNIQGAVGKDDPAVLAKVADTLSATDVCGLVEVRANARHADDRNQAQKVADVLRRGWLFAPAERRFWADGGGNGLVSRLPAGSWTRLPLPAAGDAGSHRNVLLVDVPVAGRTVKLLVTHLDRGDARPAQMRALAHLFESVRGTAVILGDLNADPFDPLVAPLLKVPGARDVISDFQGPKAKRVDWIVAKELTAVDVGRTDDPQASDHSFFWADLELPAGDGEDRRKRTTEAPRHGGECVMPIPYSVTGGWRGSPLRNTHEASRTPLRASVPPWFTSPTHPEPAS